jgi:carboxyvinyl-carboxyphosphonate phosphorylmutase
MSHLRHTEQRRRFRAILEGGECLSPASVYDPLSARVAESVGYRLGILAGSVSSNTTLAAPDLILLTLTDFADQVRRIMRASDLSLLVDADHGYGNALNVMRTVEELEHAGVSAMSIEDTALPIRFGQQEGQDELISVPEMVGKLKAAVAARRDPSTVIAGRTAALKVEDLPRTVERVKAYAACGVDCIFIIGVETAAEVRAVREASGLPVIVGPGKTSETREAFAEAGCRVLLQGHQPVAAAVKALREVYAHLHGGGEPGQLKDKIASGKEMDALVSAEDYKRHMRDFLRG